MKDALKVDLGCGNNPQPGFKGLDIRDIKGIDYPNTDVKKLPFEDSTVDVLFASHVIEHFTKRDAVIVLKEWFRALKDGGELHIKCPNFYYIVREYTETIDNMATSRKFNLLGWCYGEQDYEYNYHYFCYDPWLLKYFLEETGFARVESRFELDAQNIYLVAYK